MEKQYSGNVKDYLIQELSKRMEIDEEMCNKVVGWAYKEAKKASLLTTSVEISGFGSLILHSTKIKRKLENREKMKKIYEEKLKSDVPPHIRKKIEDSKEYNDKFILYLKDKKQKLDECNNRISEVNTKGNSLSL